MAQAYPEINGETEHERAMRKIAEATLDGMKQVAADTRAAQQLLQVLVLLAVIGAIGGLVAVLAATN